VGINWVLNSDAKYVLLLNNDTVVDPEFLNELVNVAHNDDQIGIVGPKVLYYEQPEKIASAGGKVNFWTGNTPPIGKNTTDDGRFDTIKEVDFVLGCALLIKVQTIRRIGLLNETYFAYYEETEWCIKAKKACCKVVFVPKAKIWHKGPKKGANYLAMYYMTRNRCLFVKRNSNTLQFIFFNFFFLMPDFFGEMMKLFTRPMLLVAYLKGLKDGLF
jgi:GT2 family glycosyltransferase